MKVSANGNSFNCCNWRIKITLYNRVAYNVQTNLVKDLSLNFGTPLFNTVLCLRFAVFEIYCCTISYDFDIDTCISNMNIASDVSRIIVYFFCC